MSIYDAPPVPGADFVCLVPQLKVLLFPNDGTLQAAASLIDNIGAGCFAIREAIAQAVSVQKGSNAPLPSNVPVPPQFSYTLSEDNGG